MNELGSSAPPPVDQPDQYRSWLQLLARLQIDALYLPKFDASDIVQQTLLEAHRGRATFRGHTQGEYMAWLRAILGRVLGHELRRYGGTQSRQIDRELQIDQLLDATSKRLDNLLVDPGGSPSERVIAREQSLLLADALAALPEDYREVITLRNLEGLSHEQIAQRMQRSPGAVRMLWMRALVELRKVHVALR